MLQIYRDTAAGTDVINHPLRKAWEHQVSTDPVALQNSIDVASEKLQVEISKRRIYCLTPNPSSILMWSHYAANHSGICLEFYVVNPLFLKAWKVNYCDQYPVWVPQDMRTVAGDVILAKSKDWEYEQEFRILGTPYGGSHPLKLDGDYLALPARSLQSVIVGCQGDYDAVAKIVNENAPGLAVKRAVRVANRYGLTIDDGSIRVSAE